jgi:hypothetical protein
MVWGIVRNLKLDICFNTPRPRSLSVGEGSMFDILNDQYMSEAEKRRNVIM